MIEKALRGGPAYWRWLAGLGVVAVGGGACYLKQLSQGLAVTGLSRDVAWGLYIAQFTFLVGIAASAVTVVLPYYLHDFRAFGPVTILGEFVAIAAVSTSLLFVLADMGQPSRVLNVVLHPSPRSMMFWDMVVLGGYLLLNVAITRAVLQAEAAGVGAPRRARPLILVSIPWAISIHTVTAFLYSGLPGRSFWFTALLAPRFLASAFAAGPALLILLTMLLRRLTRFDPGPRAIPALAMVVTYATAITVFFLVVEAFTAFYSRIPEHIEHFQFLFTGLGGRAGLVPWSWTSVALVFVGLGLLLAPARRRDEVSLAVAASLVFLSLWIDKGLLLVVGGFVPSPLGAVSGYAPTAIETGIAAGIWAVGVGMVTVFFKIAAGIRRGEGA
ncbi:MAG: sulfate reduction electron transfer complex DsrMKJOP subunit DsrP [Vicinamibacterales bacterium]